MFLNKCGLFNKCVAVTLSVALAVSLAVFTGVSGADNIVLQNSFDSPGDAVCDQGSTLPYSATANFRHGWNGVFYTSEVDHTGKGGGALMLGDTGSAPGRAKFFNTVERRRELIASDTGRSFEVTFWAAARTGAPTLSYGLLSIDSAENPSGGSAVLSEGWMQITYSFTVNSEMIVNKAYCFAVQGADMFIDDLKIVETTPERQETPAPTASSETLTPPEVPATPAAPVGMGKLTLENSFDSLDDAAIDQNETLPYSLAAKIRLGWNGASYSANIDHTGNGGGSLMLGDAEGVIGRARFFNTVERNRLLTDKDVGRTFEVTFWARAKDGMTSTIRFGTQAINDSIDPERIGSDVALKEDWVQINGKFTITASMIESKTYCFSVQGSNLYIDDLEIFETTPGAGDADNEQTMSQWWSNEVVTKTEFTNSGFADVRGTVYDTPARLLCALNIMEGEGGSFKPNQEMTRAEFLEATMRLCGYSETTTGSQPTSFKDVTSSHSSAWAVGVAESIGVINGVGDMLFGPDDIIEIPQAVKMVVLALGFGYKAEAMGGYPTGYMTVAASEKIFNSPTNNKVTRGTAALMLYNASRIDVPRTTGVTNGEVFSSIENGYTALTRAFGIIHSRGRITGVPNTRLNQENGVGNGRVELDGTVYFHGNSGAEEMLGLYVEYYYTENDGEGTLVYVQPTRNNSMLVIPSKRIANYENGTYEYSLNDTGKLHRVSVSLSVNVIYNGQFAIPFSGMMFPGMGEVRLLDSDNNGIYETVFIEDITYCVVDRVSERDWTLHNKFPLNADEAVFDFSDAKDRLTILDTDGEVKSLKDIAEYDVVAVRTSLGAGRLVQLTVSATKVEGIVTELGLDFISVEGVIYDTTGYFERLVSEGKITLPNVGASIRLLFTLDGRAAGYDMPRTDGKNYGYLIRVNVTQTIDSKVQFLILTSAGKIEVLECNKKVEIDGVKEVAATVLAVFGTADSTARQIFGYETNSSGLIISIDTAVKDSGESEYTLRKTFPGTDDGGGPWLFSGAGSSFNGRCNVGGMTKVFWVADSAANTDDDAYTVTNIAGFKSGLSYSDMVGYTIRDIDNFADFIVVVGSSPRLNSGVEIFLVDRIAMTVNNDGESLYRVYGIYADKETSVIVNDQANLMETINSGDIVRWVPEANGEVLIKQISSGSQRINFEHVLDADGDNGGPIIKSTNRTAFANLFLVGGHVVDIKNGFIWVDTNASPSRRAFALSGFKVYVYEKELGRFEAGTSGDINPGDYVVIRTVESAPKQIVVYK